MRQNLKRLQGRGRIVLGVVGVVLATAGCGGGGGGGGGSGGGTVAPIGPGSGPVPQGLAALVVSPPGHLTLFGDPTTATVEQQVLVSGSWSNATRDLTRSAMYQVADGSVLRVSGDGLVHALKAGTTTVTVSQTDGGGRTVTTQFAVTVDPSKGLGGANGSATMITMYPASRTLADVNAATGTDELQQLVVVASYADGTTADLTRTLPFSVVDATNMGPTVAARITQGALLRATQAGAVDVIADYSAAGMQAAAQFIIGNFTGNVAPIASATTSGTSSTNPVSSSAQGSIAKVSGDDQQAQINTAYANPLIVQVSDPTGAPLTGKTVTFTVIAGGATLSAASGTTDMNGQAAVSITGTKVGQLNVTASVGGIGAVCFFGSNAPLAAGSGLSYQNDIGPLFQTACVRCHVSGGQAGLAPLDTYQAVTAGTTKYANTPATYVVAGNPAQSLIIAKITGKAGTDMSAAQYGNLNAAQVQEITQWVQSGAANAPGSGTSAPPKTLVIAEGNNQAGAASSKLPVAVGVYVLDASGTAVSGATVAFVAATGGGTLSAPSATTDATGLAAITVILGPAVGTNTNTITATVTGLAPVTFDESSFVSNFQPGVLASSTNAIDVAVVANLKLANVSPAALSTDDEFIRRTTAVLIGRLPTTAELTAFRADQAANKRATLIDSLIAMPAFGTHWSKDVFNVWISVPNSNTASIDTEVAALLNADTPITTIVTNLVTQQGVEGAAFAATFKSAYMQSDTLMQAFTGMSSKCGRCHNHHLTGPNDDPMWTQNDNYSLYAFFATSTNDATEIDVNGNKVIDPVTKKAVMMQPNWVTDGYKNAPAAGTLPLLTDAAGAMTPLAPRLAAFAKLMTGSHAFARGTAHRIFSEVATPLIDPNQFLAVNLAGVAAPTVLETLAQEFTKDGFSLKAFLREVLNSKTWQLSSAGTSTAGDAVLARFQVQRIHAEVADQGMSEVAGVNYAANAFVLFNFGYPSTRAAIDERNNSVNMSQFFCVMNSPQAANGRIAMNGSAIIALANQVTAKTMTMDQAVTAIFNSALSRDPSANELSQIKTIAATAPTTQVAINDVAMGVQSSIEFMMRQ